MSGVAIDIKLGAPKRLHFGAAHSRVTGSSAVFSAQKQQSLYVLSLNRLGIPTPVSQPSFSANVCRLTDEGASSRGLCDRVAAPTRGE